MSMETELAARMPWTFAEPDSMWHVTGSRGGGHTFIDCLARVLPGMVTGTDAPVFEVLVYGGGYCAPASAIASALELFLVDAKNPREAYYADDQAALTQGLERTEPKEKP